MSADAVVDAADHVPGDLQLAHFLLVPSAQPWDDAVTGVGRRLLAAAEVAPAIVEATTVSRDLLGAAQEPELMPHEAAVHAMTQAYRAYSVLRSARSHSTWLGTIGSVGLVVARAVYSSYTSSASAPPPAATTPLPSTNGSFWFVVGVSVGVVVAAQARWLVYDEALARATAQEARRAAQAVAEHHQRHRRRRALAADDDSSCQ